MGDDEAKLTDIRMRKEEKPSFLASIVESSDDAIIGKTLDGIILSWNSGAEKIYGYSADEVIGKPISILVPPDRPDEIPQLLERIGQGERIEHYETMRVRKDGKRIDISLTISPIKDTTGRIIGASTIARDITERKMAEEALRKAYDELEMRVQERTVELTRTNEALKTEIAERKRSEEALWKERNKAQNYLNIAGVMIVVINTNQKVTLVNKKCSEVLGYKEQEIIGRNWFDTFVPERARDEVRAAFMKLVAGEIEPVEYFENPVLSREGTERLIAWHNAVLQDDAGNITGTLSSGEDITERRQIEERLREAKELSDALNRINTSINSTLDFDKIMQYIVVESAKAIGCETAAITLREDNYWIIRYHYNFPAEMTDLRLTDEEIPHGALAAQSKQTVIINDAYKDKRVNLEVMKKYGVRSVLVAPLVIRERIIGLIYFNYHSAPVVFTSAQVDFANKLATSVSLAMQNARLFGELENRAKIIEALYAVDRVISQSLDLDTIFRDALSKTLDVTEIDGGGIYLLDEDRETLSLKHYQGVSPELAQVFSKVKVGVGVGGLAVKSGKPATLDVEKYPSSPLRSLLVKDGIFSLASTPLIAKGKAIGAITFINRKSRSFSQDDLDLIASIGSEIGVAVENARLYEELKRVAGERERWAAELARSNAELEQFAYIASHDLQEPLRMVSGFTQLLAKRYTGKLDKDADEFITYIVDGTRRMQSMIEDLLAYSRVGTRGKPFEHTDFESVLDQAVTNLKVPIEENKAQITHDPLPAVMADSIQMAQLLQNLIGNALKFRKKEEPPRIHVSAKRKKNE